MGERQIRMENLPVLPEGHRYRVVEAKSSYLKVVVVELNTRTGTGGLYPDRAVATLVTGPDRMGGWEFMTSAERVETGLRLVGKDFMSGWNARRETEEMTALVGDYEPNGRKCS